MLIVDDDEASRSVFREILHEAGIAARCVDHDALPEPDGFTTVITDLPVPRSRYSSERTREWVGALRDRYRVPVIVVTGRVEADRDAELRAIASVMLKPVELDEFVDRIRRADRRRVPR